MRHYPDPEERDVACPKCHAERGQLCRSKAGKPTTAPHRPRTAAARAADGERRRLDDEYAARREAATPTPAARRAARQRAAEAPLRGSVDDPTFRVMRARLAAFERWSRASTEDRAEQARRMQRGTQGRFEKLVDPDGTLPHAERIKRAEAAKRAHMTRMSMQSRAKRKK